MQRRTDDAFLRSIQNEVMDDHNTMERTTAIEASDLNKLLEYISNPPTDQNGVPEEGEKERGAVIMHTPLVKGATTSEERKTKQERKKEKRRQDQARDRKKKRLQKSRNKKFEQLAQTTKTVVAKLTQAETDSQKRKEVLHSQGLAKTKRLGRLG